MFSQLRHFAISEAVLWSPPPFSIDANPFPPTASWSLSPPSPPFYFPAPRRSLLWAVWCLMSEQKRTDLLQVLATKTGSEEETGRRGKIWKQGKPGVVFPYFYRRISNGWIKKRRKKNCSCFGILFFQLAGTRVDQKNGKCLQPLEKNFFFPMPFIGTVADCWEQTRKDMS